MLLPRLDRMLSSMGRENGGRPDPSFIPKAAFEGEDEEYAQEMVRVTTRMVLELIRVNKGALLTQPVERGLNDWYRFMFPGRETPEDWSFNHGDGSGNGWYMMNNDTGEELQHFFTSEEAAAFNNFGAANSITIDNIELAPSCLGTPLLAPTLAKLKKEQGHTLTGIIELQDNTVAEHSIA